MDVEEFRGQVQPLFPGVTGRFGLLHYLGPIEGYWFTARDVRRCGDFYCITFNPNDPPSTSWHYGGGQPGRLIYGRGKTLEEALANHKRRAEVTQ